MSRFTIELLSVHGMPDNQTITGSSMVEPDEQTCNILSAYFENIIKPGVVYQFYHPDSLDLNEIYQYTYKIFNNPEQFYEASLNIARHLLNRSRHLNIKPGELYIALLSDNDNPENEKLLGILKAETKTEFINSELKANKWNINTLTGTDIQKPDKGCIISNAHAAQGYVVNAIDNTNRSSDARYWFDDFLGISEMHDAFFNTKKVMSLCSGYLNHSLPQEFEVSRADQADLLQRTARFFKENDNFSFGKYEEEVIQQPAVIEQFKNYRKNFETANEIEISDGFEISEQAVKKQARVFKSVLKLDKNFHVYIHGNRQLIERGTEDDGRKFYKIYFNEEN